MLGLDVFVLLVLIIIHRPVEEAPIVIVVLALGSVEVHLVRAAFQEERDESEECHTAEDEYEDTGPCLEEEFYDLHVSPLVVLSMRDAMVAGGGLA